MSDLDQKLTALRTGLEAQLTPPDLAHVARRARQRTVRRRMQLGAVAAVVLVSVAVPLLRSMPSDDPRPSGPPAPPPTYQLDFADADRGYALGSVCAPLGGPCSLTLLATDDGGKHWRPRSLPGTSGPHAMLTVVGPEQVTIDRMSTGSDVYVQRISSTDGGRTWQGVTPNAPGTPRPISPSAPLQQVCLGADDGCATGLGAPLPGSDGFAPALSQPPLVEPQPGAAATEDGKRWAAGRDPATDAWAVAVSADAGATWATTVLDVPGTPSPSGGWSMVERDGVLYATVNGAVGTGPVGLLAVFRSTDAGRSWTRTWHTAAGANLWGVAGNPIATADGRLLVYSASLGTFESADGGRTFAMADQQLPAQVRWTRAGYLVSRAEDDYEISTDGVTWRRFTIR